MTDTKYNEYQKQYIESEFGQNISVIATPGSGKTFSIVERIKKANEKGLNARVLCFNVSVATEIQKKLGSIAKASTYHSFVLSALNEYMGCKIEILQDYDLKTPLYKYYSDIIKNNTNSISFLVNYILHYFTFEKTLVEKSFLEIYELDNIAEKIYMLCDSKKSYTQCMLIHKFCELVNSDKKFVKFISDKYDVVIVDEAQDILSKFIKAMIVAYDNKLELVGDPNQFLNGFAGSDRKNLIDFKGKKIEFKINYRSDKDIVNFSNNIFDVKAIPNSKEFGIVEKTTELEKSILECVKKYGSSNVAVLGRTSYSLALAEAYLIKNNIPYYSQTNNSFFDYEFVQFLCNTIKWKKGEYINKAFSYIPPIDSNYSFLYHNFFPDKINKDYDKKNHQINEFMRMMNYASSSYEKCYDVFLSYKQKNDAVKIDDFDLYHTCVAFIAVHGEDLLLKYADKKIRESKKKLDGVCISTIHKAKGLEWPCVILANTDDDVIPNKTSMYGFSNNIKNKMLITYYPTSNEETELCCYYVAVTRAKNHLILHHNEGKESYFIKGI